MNRLSFRFTLPVLVLVSLLSACSSTTKEEEPLTCRPNISSCTEAPDTSDDRGYDPCLINKELPVCKQSE
jgi:hypothetical protein